MKAMRASIGANHANLLALMKAQAVVSRRDHEAAEHGRRIMRERREREAAELRRANAVQPWVDPRE